ncbi:MULTISPECIES: putative ABC transporter permease [unclassified Clostridium]|uniref:putative ABC transporter permease n=1 Tax=unclassified Clostridium TaxID=2614128 RepID=UPI0002985C62|nr:MULTISPECIES: putative ABC transporter permease [unclassified Clostridium]EKQ53842.1 MAG: putative membrane protein [Clostridium sp. Maddingley MBC34-26]
MRTILSLNLYNIIYFFTLYSFGGWCLEVLYYFKNEHRFVNRGFLYGPFCPIYGFGVVFLVVFLDSYKDNIFSLFFLAAFFTTVLEYITGFILEKTFKTKWWDYTDDPLNIHGRVCLPYSLLWGIGEVIIIKIVHPIVSNFISDIPKTLGEMFIFISIVYFIIDFCLTILSLIQFDKLFYSFQFVPVNFLIDKPSTLFNFTKGKAVDKLKNFESLFGRFKFTLNHRNLRSNFSNKSYKQLNYLFQVLKDKFKKD